MDRFCPKPTLTVERGIGSAGGKGPSRCPRLWKVTLRRHALPGSSHTTIKSFPTTISPLKYLAAAARQGSSVMPSVAGTRCDSTQATIRAGGQTRAAPRSQTLRRAAFGTRRPCRRSRSLVEIGNSNGMRRQANQPIDFEMQGLRGVGSGPSMREAVMFREHDRRLEPLAASLCAPGRKQPVRFPCGHRDETGSATEA